MFMITYWENHNYIWLPFHNDGKIELHLEALEGLMDHNILNLCGRNKSS